MPTFRPSPPPSRPTRDRGLVTRKQWNDFLGRMSSALGFSLNSGDFASVTHTGTGLHIERKQHAYTTMGLELWRQYRWAEAYDCYAYYDSGSDTYYKVKTITTVYENGTVHETYTAGGRQIFTVGGTYGCPTEDYTTDRIDGFDYGAYVSGIITGSTPLDPSTLLADAKSNLTNDGSPALAQSWQWSRELTAPGDPVLHVLDLASVTIVNVADITQALGYWSSISAVDVKANSYRYRWKNTSPKVLHLQWDTDSGTHNLDLDPATTSSWYDDLIATDPDTPDTVRNLEITQD